MSKPNSDRKRGCLNVSLPSDLSKAAKEIFKRTKYKALSRFIEAKIKQELKLREREAREAGVRIPDSVYVRP